MKALRKTFLTLACIAAGAVCFAQQLSTDTAPVIFEFRYKKGDNYRILSQVEEDVYVNRVKNSHATIINRVTSEITEVNPDGSAEHSCNFMTTEENTGARNNAHFSYGEEYESKFTRGKNGVYKIPDIYFMPTVRDVPTFPDYQVNPGDKWTAKGHEAHDLRKGFGIEKPFKVPFNAEYTYVGVESKTGLHVIRARYSMFSENPAPKDPSAMHDFPKLTQGYSDEVIYWDNKKGTIDHYHEKFRILIETAQGNLYEFTGSAKAEVTEFKRSNTEENVAAVQEIINDMGLENVTVAKSDMGLTISLEDIKFKPDSAILMDSEKIKIQKIAEILVQWPENDILVTGHTALAGNARMRKELSMDRANTVAEYLINLKVRDRFHVFTQGLGAERPIASNNTEEGKAKNRRVEITLMDK